MIDEEYLNTFIREAKKAYKTIDDKTYNFPITINTAYRLAVNIEKRLKKQPNIVRCKDCKHRDPEDHKCDCGHDIRWQTPREDDWFCADGEKEGGKET